MKTWEVIERRLFIPSDSLAMSHETVAAICATSDQAQQEMCRLAMLQSEPDSSWCLPRWEMCSYYIRRGSVLIGVDAQPTVQQ